MLHCLSVCKPSTPGLPMPSHNDQNRSSMSLTTNNRSFLVTISARALGSLGLGLSILAIWLRWLVPSATANAPEVPTTQTNHRHRRRSTEPHAMSIPPIPTIVPPTIFNTTPPDDTNRTKHVYFADTPISQRKTPPVEPVFEGELPQMPPEDSQAQSYSPSPTVLSNTFDTLMKSDTYDESIAESDSSSRRSSISLPRIMNPFGGKARRSSGPPETITNTYTRSPLILDNSKPVRRSSIGFSAPWSATRNRRPTAIVPDVISPVPSSSYNRPSTKSALGLPPSPSVNATQSPTSASYFSRKTNRRASTPVPIPRTLPYEAPYFASPPVPFSHFDLRDSPQFRDSISIRPTRAPTSASLGATEKRGREPRQANTQGQAALGNGRPRTLPKRRSASESWANCSRTLHV